MQPFRPWFRQCRAPAGALVWATLVAGGAHAADGTITFSGTVNDVTCSISVAGQTRNGTVTLPSVTAGSLGSSGTTAGTMPFSIALSGCTGSTLNQARTRFEVGTNVDVATGRLNNTGTATNVQIQLLASDKAAIVVGASSPYDVPVSIAGNAATLQYYARYYATGAAGAGSVASTVEYTIVYN